jgi:hypothetical protein
MSAGSARLSWRTLAPLCVFLLIELAVCIGLALWGSEPRFSNARPAVALFVVAAPVTALAYWLLLRFWRRTDAAWKRFGLCLLAAFVTYQVVVALFFVLAGWIRPSPDGDIWGWTVLGLLVANTVFFPIWIILGALMFGLLLVFLGVAPRSDNTASGATASDRATDVGDLSPS